MTDIIDEAQLIEDLRSGSDEAFELLVRTYSLRILYVARRYMRVEEDARDIVQETMLQVFRKVKDFNSDSSLWTWMHKIAVNQCLMRLRSLKNRMDKHNNIDDLLPQFAENGDRLDGGIWRFESSVESLVENAQTRKIVLEAINKLPENYRLILMLRDIEEYSTEETALKMDMTETAVKTRLHRARAGLKKLLEPLFNEIGGK